LGIEEVLRRTAELNNSHAVRAEFDPHAGRVRLGMVVSAHWYELSLLGCI
jgi:hypothetical protein